MVLELDSFEPLSPEQALSRRTGLGTGIGSQRVLALEFGLGMEPDSIALAVVGTVVSTVDTVVNTVDTVVDTVDTVVVAADTAVSKRLDIVVIRSKTCWQV